MTTLKPMLAFVLLCTIGVSTLRADSAPDELVLALALADDGIGDADEKEDAPPTPAPKTDVISDAERIGRLQRSLEKDKVQLEQLLSELTAAEAEFTKAGQIFNKVDGRVTEAKTKLEQAGDDAPAETKATLTKELENVKEKWSLCKERFDLSLEARKGLKQQVAALKEKIEQDQAALKKLADVDELPAESAAPPASTETKPAPASDAAKKEAAPAESATTTPSADPAPLAPPVESPTPSAETATKASFIPGSKERKKELDAEVVADLQEARNEVSRQEAVANEARAALASLEKRQQSLDKNIALEQQLRDAARKQADNALRVSQEFQEDFRVKSTAGAPAEELATINQRVQSSQTRLEKARLEVKRRTDRLDELNAQRHTLMSERIVVLEEADTQQQIAAKARQRLEELENPFSRRNVTRWVFSHAPNVLVILVGFLVLRLVVKIVCRRVVVLMTHRGSGTRKERENRAETIVSVFQNAATLLCYTGSSLMVLEECGVPVGPLLGGAAVVGLAFAFGSQNLIRDYFYGFVILLENQYGMNDVVQIGKVTGKVERITLRMTVVRDQEGVNFIPNGSIESVKNLTHGWSQAVLEVSISYKENVDRVMEILTDLGKELRKDPRFDDMILEDPSMLGIEQLGESAVVLKFVIKTKPLEQWNVKREMLRRVKNRFDELGIEIPSPQRTINHRYVSADGNPIDDESLVRWQQRKSA